MKNSSALAAIIMAVVGVGGIAGSTSGFGIFSSPNSNTSEQNGLLEGHFTVIAKHPDGTVYAYSQSDNTVTTEGKSCLAGAAFGGNGTNLICTNGVTKFPRFTWIAIGNGTTAPLDTDITLQVEALRQNATQVAINGLTGGVGVVNATTGGHAYAVSTTTFTIPTETTTLATNGPGNGTTKSIKAGTAISEAGLFDGQAAGRVSGAHIFAHTAVSPTVSISPNDQLTVKYSIAIG